MTQATKRLKLTTDQVKEIRDAFQAIELAGEMLAEMFAKLSEKHAKKSRLTWESVAELVGADRDLFTSGGAGIEARINYLTSEVILTGTAEDLDAAVPHIPLHD